MTSNLEKISIIMATFNREQFIKESVQSIINQTYTNWECFIIDDGGTDNTAELLKETLNKDPRIKYFKRPDSFKKGLPGCRNYGLSLATGNYVIFFDDDDIIHPANLEVCISALNTNKGAHFCNYLKRSFEGEFDYSAFDDNNDYSIKITTNSILEDVITQKTPFASCSVMWKKACFNDNSFNEELMYAEEWECFQRILSTGVSGVLIDKYLYFNRKHSNSNTGEYWKKNPKRINSKKKAISLIVANLQQKELLSSKLFRYLLNLAISFRDFKLIKGILLSIKISRKEKMFCVARYYLFPLWRLKKKIAYKLKINQ